MIDLIHLRTFLLFSSSSSSKFVLRLFSQNKKSIGNIDFYKPKRQLNKPLKEIVSVVKNDFQKMNYDNLINKSKDNIESKEKQLESPEDSIIKTYFRQISSNENTEKTQNDGLFSNKINSKEEIKSDILNNKNSTNLLNDSKNENNKKKSKPKAQSLRKCDFKIPELIELMKNPVSPKLGPYIFDNISGENKILYWCSCGLSKTQPFCDRNHIGSNFSRIAFPITQNERQIKLCGCKYSSNKPYCDLQKCEKLNKTHKKNDMKEKQSKN